MTDEQKLTFLLTELKILARETHCYDKYGDFYDGTDQPHSKVFDDGSEYGLVSFARSILESMGETYNV